MPREDRSPERRVRDYAAQQNVPQDEALKKGLEEKAAEFKQSGAEIYSKA